jgi:hypothetical protein
MSALESLDLVSDANKFDEVEEKCEETVLITRCLTCSLDQDLTSRVLLVSEI